MVFSFEGVVTRRDALGALPPVSNESLKTWLAPSIIAGLSFLSFVLSLILKARRTRNDTSQLVNTDGPHLASSQKTEISDGRVICAYKKIQLLGVLSLASLSAYRLLVRLDADGIITRFVIYLYCSILAILSLHAGTEVRDRAFQHLAVILSATFFNFSVLDIWPLIQMGHRSSRPSSAKWIEIIILVLIGIAIPLFIPTAFRPTSSEELPRPDQTPSLFSRVTFAFVDNLIFRAYRVPDLTVQDLPELGHSDRASTLFQKAANHIDPLQIGARRHIFWSIVIYFRSHFARVFSWLVLHSVLQFLSPYALKGLLSELDSQSPNLQPWVWAVMIGIGPILSSIVGNQIYTTYTHLSMQQESLLTQVIFNHSLRLRLDSHKLDNKGNNSSSESGSSSTPKQAHSAKTETDNIVGNINNLVSSDMSTISGSGSVLLIPGTFIQLGIAMAFLYSLLGWSAFIGFAVIIICIPLPTYVAKLSLSTEQEKKKMTDRRVQAVTEAIDVLRMIKLFAWEPKILQKLNDKREVELKYIRRQRLLGISMHIVHTAMPILSYMATISVYTLALKKPFPPSIAFTSLTLFEMVRGQIAVIGNYIPWALQAKVAYDRINEFLKMTDLLPESPRKTPETRTETDPPSSAGAIGFSAASFSWHEPSELSDTSRAFRLRSEGSVEFKKDGFNIIIGPTGSGKTSVLMALLGEMYYTPTGPTSWFNRPHEGGVAYAAQEGWVLNGTIRDNILFGNPHEERRYKKVLDHCGLERDLEIWNAGDLTEVGERGLTLSGGQKARLTLARALYSPAQTLLLDDILAALDVHTAKHVVDSALSGELVSRRTVILVTHNVSLVAPIADHVVVLGKHGHITEHGSVAEVLKRDVGLHQEIVKEQVEVEQVSEVIAEALDEGDKKGAGKLVIAEEKEMGHVSLQAFLLFSRGWGGLLAWVVFLSLTIGGQLMSIGLTAWVSNWSSQYEKYPASQIPVLKYLGVYALIALLQLLLDSVAAAGYSIFSVRACRKIHQKLILSILGAPLRWLDTVPVGRITTRCTQDLATIDGPFLDMFQGLLQLTISLLLFYLTTIFLTGWIALVCGAIVAGLGGWLGNVYLKAQLSVRREQSNAKAPVISQVGVALQGLVSIRAYGAQSAFQAELRRRLDTLMRCTATFYNLNRWIGVRSETLGGLFAGIVTLHMVYFQDVGSARVGFVLSVVVSFSQQILVWIRIYNFLEVSSLERILGFTLIEQEPKPAAALKPPAYWPATGSTRVEGLSARYADNLPEVLKDLTFEVKPGERIGVVGRTGAGKSSLALALLRAIKTTGKVYFDDLATDIVNLDALRNAISLIPQQPELLPGTVRENLDPFGQHEDAALNDALRTAGLFDLQERIHGVNHELEPREVVSASEGTAKIALDSEVRGGGSNFSVGQRQIIALARAMLRRSKLLILDEATAAIDNETDAVIQRFLRTELDKNTTVITIAHRLQTIMDSDRILALDAGKLVEYDTPKNLLRKQGGFFRSLVEESNDRYHLTEMVTA